MCDRIYVMNEGAFVGEFAARGRDARKESCAHDHGKGQAAHDEHPDHPRCRRPTSHVALRQASAGEHPRRYGMLLSLVAIMLFFQVMTDGTLLQPLNLTNLVLQNSYIVIMALGMLLVIVAGHIDLSVGSVVGFVGAVAARADGSGTMPWWLAVIVPAWSSAPRSARRRAIGSPIFEIPSFIVTLAGMLVFRGLALVLLHGARSAAFRATSDPVPSGCPNCWPVGRTYVPTMVLAHGRVLLVVFQRQAASPRKLDSRIEVAAPFSEDPLAVAAVLGCPFTSPLLRHPERPGHPGRADPHLQLRAPVGDRRQIYAVGGNLYAAILSGIKTERVTFRSSSTWACWPRSPGSSHRAPRAPGQGRPGLRARRHRRLLHRRCGLRRRRHGQRRHGRRPDHGRAEQRHVDPVGGLGLGTEVRYQGPGAPARGRFRPDQQAARRPLTRSGTRAR